MEIVKDGEQGLSDLLIAEQSGHRSIDRAAHILEAPERLPRECVRRTRSLKETPGKWVVGQFETFTTPFAWSCR